MNTIIGALALILAAPVAAQTAPAAGSHAGHAQHQQAPSAPAEHKMDCKCCDESRDQAQMKDCCDKHAAEHAADSAGNVLPASVIPAADGTYAWLFFTNPMPGGSSITVTVPPDRISTTDFAETTDDRSRIPLLIRVLREIRGWVI